MAKIEIQSSCLVGMSTNVQIRPTAVPRTLDLSPWDLFYLAREPIQKGLLFHKPDQTPDVAKISIVDHLKHSLSRTLDFFPPLSGRFGTVRHDDGTVSFFIECNDAGAGFSYAVAAGVSVADVLEPMYIPDIVSSFFSLNGILNHEGVSNPLLAVQVTELVDGFFIGCTVNHVAIDGSSFWHFFKSWSEISRGSDTISKAPVFNRWLPSKISGESRWIHLPPLGQTPTYNVSPPPLLQRVFHFSKDSLAMLKHRANSEASQCRSTISTLQALSAHLWRSVIRARHQKTILEKDSSMAAVHGFPLLVDARARIPLQDGYFGNAIHYGMTAVAEDELLQNGIGFSALKINELVSEQTREAVIKLAEDWVEKPLIPRKGVVKFAITSSPRFDIYGCNFGWGKPVAARSGSTQKMDGKMTVDPAAESGGVDVTVCLAPETMHALEDDAEFLKAFAV